MEKIVNSNMAGGVGEVIIEPVLNAEQMGKSARLYARVTIPAGSSLGYHEHHGESETYFILSGSGVYDDNGTKRTVRAGDVTFTPSGCGHALDNTAGTEPVVFMALILMA